MGINAVNAIKKVYYINPTYPKRRFRAPMKLDNFLQFLRCSPFGGLFPNGFGRYGE
jgi:hypothetical protein